MMRDLIEAATKLVECVSRDVNGLPGMPFSGNGGLVSNETIRAADECRLALHETTSLARTEGEKR